jgi:hypothetical protein
MFEAQARRHWDERLRKLGVGKDFTDLAARDRTISLADDHRKEWAREIRRRAKNLDDQIVAHGIDSFVPSHWPTREGMPIPIGREIEEGDASSESDRLRRKIWPRFMRAHTLLNPSLSVSSMSSTTWFLSVLRSLWPSCIRESLHHRPALLVPQHRCALRRRTDFVPYIQNIGIEGSRIEILLSRTDRSPDCIQPRAMHR